MPTLGEGQTLEDLRSISKIMILNRIMHDLDLSSSFVYSILEVSFYSELIIIIIKFIKV
jgi:hypothetical protein